MKTLTLFALFVLGLSAQQPSTATPPLTITTAVSTAWVGSKTTQFLIIKADGSFIGENGVVLIDSTGHMLCTPEVFAAVMARVAKVMREQYTASNSTYTSSFVFSDTQ